MRAALPPRTAAGSDSGSERLRLIVVFAIALAMTGAPIMLHLVSQPLAIVVCVAAAVAAARLLERDTPVIVLTALIFQNVFVSLTSPLFSDPADLEPLKSYSFITAIVIWLTIASSYLTQQERQSPFVRRLIFGSLIVLFIVGVYFLAGLAINPRNAAVYVRNIGQPILFFQMFLIVASRHELALPTIVSILLVAVSICGYLEVFAIDFWFYITNGQRALELAYANRLTSVTEIKAAQDSGVVITSLFDYMTTDFLNLNVLQSLNIRFKRLQGPHLHPISFGYLLAVLAVFAAVHRRLLLALLATPLLLLTNAKGPLILAITCLVFTLLAQRRRDNDRLVWMLLVVVAAYAVVAFRSGVSSGDFHVLGLLGGVYGFLRRPIGHSLGEGGNLSIVDFASIDWSKFQHAGATDIAVESAVGVLLFQLGVAAAVVFVFYLWLARVAWRLYRVTGAPALALSASAIVVILVNGVFQEEAYFAPLGLGLVMSFVGLSLGAADRVLGAQLARNAQARPSRAPIVSWSIRPRPSRSPNPLA